MKRLLWVGLLFCTSAMAELAPEPLNVVKSLPDSYPPSWILAVDGAFFHMSNGKIIVLDAASDDPVSRFKGFFNGSFIPQLYQLKTKPQIVISETYHSRGNRGDRTDVITIYDKADLSPLGEVIIPSKRASGMPTHYHMQMTHDERFALVFNFTPAQSVSVIDMDAMAFVGEVSLPGCALIYPMSDRSFASMCGDGTFHVVNLDDDGNQASTAKSEKIWDSDNDPLMEKAAFHDGMGYWPSFDGELVSVDMTGDVPTVESRWSFVDGIEGGWLPGGLSVLAEGSPERRCRG